MKTFISGLFLIALFLPHIACAQTVDPGNSNAQIVVANSSLENENENSPADSAFVKAVKKNGHGQIFKVCADPVGQRVLADYGAIFLAQNVTVPKVCQFLNDDETQRWQNSVDSKKGMVGGGNVELQTAAFDALIAAQKEAQKKGLNIAPSMPQTASRRSFSSTLTLWNSRFHPALAHWIKLKRLTQSDAQRLRNLPLNQQVAEVLNLEEQGIYFSKDWKKSILYSVAAPGTSQHISMLALDVKQYGNKTVREILAKHGWFQTVKSDAPHFTYLGLNSDDLPALGLKKETINGQDFWFPDMPE